MGEDCVLVGWFRRRPPLFLNFHNSSISPPPGTPSRPTVSSGEADQPLRTPPSPPRDALPAHCELWGGGSASSPPPLPPGTPSRPTVSSCGSLGEAAEGQLLVLVSDKQARVLATPSHSCLCKLQITETSFVVRAEVISLKGG